MQQGRGSGMIIGQKGVKYGLIVPGRGDSGSAKPGAQAPPGVRKPAGGGAGQKLAAFGADTDSEEEDVGSQVARQAAKKRSDTKVQDMYAAALAEDPTAFDYDGVYEEMQAEKAVPRQQERLDRRPKYIATLLEQAQLRKRDEDIAFERRQLKERSKEDHLYDDSERFVTAAYRRKLEEDKKWQEEQKQREAEEAANDVTKLGHMGNFYKNLMKKNVAFGAAKEPAAASTSQRGATAEAAAAAPAAATREAAAHEMSPAAAEPSAGVSGQREGSRDLEEGPGSRAAPAGEAGHARAPGAAASSREEGAAGNRRPLSSLEVEEQRQVAGPSGNVAAPEPADGQQAAGGTEGASAASGASTEVTEAGASAVVSGKRRNDEDAVAAARARYLARKQRVK